MRIAIFAETYYPFISGVVTHIQTLKEGLEAEGHEVLIVTLNPKSYRHYVKDGVLYCPAITLKKIYGYGIANPVNLKRLEIVRKFKPDIIHLHTEFSMGIFALFAAKQLKLPVVYTLHTMYDDYVFYLFPNKKISDMAKPAAHAFIKKVADKATEIIGPSKKVAEYLQRCGVTQPVHVIPNTVDTSSFMKKNVNKTDVETIKEKLGIAPEDVALCFVGRLGKEKSLDVLIDYFAAAVKGNKKFKLFIIGDGPEKQTLEEQVRALQVEDQVKLLGRIEHEVLPAYYHAFNLFSTASLSEMNSISLLEATASGLFAVNRLDCENLDQIVSGKNGEVFTSSKEYAETLAWYAALPLQEKQALRKSVSEYANRYGRREFTLTVLDVYEEAIRKYKK
ncbi:MAG: glycosyltransferase [Oscillospiraceae bacterium]